MTVAALGAEDLEESLGGPSGPGRRFQKRLAKVNAAPWAMATAQDLRVPGVIGGSPGLADRLMHRYMDRAVVLSIQSDRVRLTLLETMNMIQSPFALFHPRIALEVLRGRTARRKEDGVSATGHRLPGAA